MTDAEFRDLFMLLEEPVEPRPEFVERLLNDIAAVASPLAEDTRGAQDRHSGTRPDGSGERGYFIEEQGDVAVASELRRRRRGTRLIVAVAAAVFAAVAVAVAVAGRSPDRKPVAPAPHFEQHLYWSALSGIRRADLDGTGVVRNLIPFNGGGGVENPVACCVAVDRNFVYWPTGSTIARAKLDGTGVDTTLITVEFTSSPAGFSCIAVDGAHIYWVTAGGSIGRANIDGTGFNADFITGLSSSAASTDATVRPCGVAVDGRHIFWGDPSTGSIGRANLDGSGVKRDFITGLGTGSGTASSAPGVCVGAADGAHIYWATSTGTIGRANADGTRANNSFIGAPPGAARYPGVCGHDSTEVYWANIPVPALTSAVVSIGRARLDGMDVQAAFISAGKVVADPMSPVLGLALGPVSGCAVGP